MGDVPHFFPDTGNVTSADEFSPEAQQDVVRVAIRILIFVIGILGNLMVIFMILILAEYKKAVTHWYVLQLAIADSLFLLTLPLRAAETLDKNWRNEVWSCKLKETVMFLNYYSSICFLVVMSIDRYVAVCHWRPTSILQKLRTPTAATFISIGVWIVSFLLCTPVLLYSTSIGQKPWCTCQYVFPKYRNATRNCIDDGNVFGTEAFENCVYDQDHTPESYCVEKFKVNGTQEDWDYYLTEYENLFGTTPSPLEYFGDVGAPVDTADPAFPNQGCHYIGYAPGLIGFLWINFIMMFVIPLIVIPACYTMIIIRLHVNRSIAGNGRKKRKSWKSSRNKTRVTIMCACMVVLFVICWLPFHGVHLAKMQGIYSKSSKFCSRLSQIVSLIAFGNSMLNPIVYNFVGTPFMRRINSAVAAVRESVRKRANCLSGTVHYHHRKRATDHQSSNSDTGTVTTKVFKGKTEVTSGGEVFTEEIMLSDEQQRGAATLTLSDLSANYVSEACSTRT